MFNTTLIPFDHTYILYDPESIISLPLAIWSLFPIMVLIFLFSWFLLTREIEPCLLAVGQVINDITSSVFKKLVKYERPLNGRVFKESGGLTWGMPSSHSQFIAFWSTYCTLMYLWHYPPKAVFNLPFNIRKFEKGLVKLLGCSGLVVSVSLVVASRLYFEYHNVNQVIVGLSLGSLLGSLWYLLVCVVRDIGLINWVLHWRIADILLMKDSYGSPSTSISLKDERSIWLNNSKNSL